MNAQQRRKHRRGIARQFKRLIAQMLRISEDLNKNRSHLIAEYGEYF
jgi:hypothetical protein